MSTLSSLLDLWLGRLSCQQTHRPVRIAPPRDRSDKRLAVKHGGRLKMYRVNKYGEVFEEK
jgi:hypothetical protein